MPNLKKLTIMGHVGKDPEMRTTTSGTQVCTFSVAVNDKRNDTTVWFKAVAWGKQAETLNQYVHKGDAIYLDGELRLNEWTTKEGEKRTDLELHVQNFTFLGSKQDKAEPEPQGDGEDLPF